jgi:hypothetical protein
MDRSGGSKNKLEKEFGIILEANYEKLTKSKKWVKTGKRIWPIGQGPANCPIAEDAQN